MSVKYVAFVLVAAPTMLAIAGCAKGSSITADGGSGGSISSVSTTGTGGNASHSASQSGTGGNTSCGDMCDQDGDGVVDGTDACPDTPAGEMVNKVGCSASQLTPKLEEMFPPYGLTWTPTGDPGRAGGLTWSYTGIDRGDLFHIYWVPCDDPTTPCGVSLDGPIDPATEKWQFSAADSNLAGGKLVFLNATHIVLADMTTPALTGRLTLTIVDANQAPLPFATLATLGVTGQDGQYGAEIPGTGFTVNALIEVEDATAIWTPYLDYFDAASTPDPGPGTAVSIRRILLRRMTGRAIVTRRSRPRRPATRPAPRACSPQR